MPQPPVATQVDEVPSVFLIGLAELQVATQLVPSRAKFELHLVQVAESVHSAQLRGQLRHPCWLSFLNCPAGQAVHAVFELKK